MRPFAGRALPRVGATMDALTPGRVSRPAQVCLLHVHGLRDHSASNHPVSRRRSFRTLPLSPTALPPSSQRRRVKASPLAGRLAGSQEAESSSSSCGLAVHLLLLPAPPRGDAVAVGYRPESVCPEGTLTPPTVHARRRTSPRREPWGRGAHPGKPRQGRKRRLTETTDRRSVGVCRPSRGWANGLPESHGLRRGLGVCRPSRGWALRTTSPGLTPWATFCRPCGAG